jgi:hypothetical protein
MSVCRIVQLDTRRSRATTLQAFIAREDERNGDISTGGIKVNYPLVRATP